MPNAPPSPFTALVQKPRQWKITLGNTTGAAPGVTEETAQLRNPVITLAHGSKLPHADFIYTIEGTGRRITDIYLETGFARQVEVSQLSSDPALPPMLLFWGELGTQALTVAKVGEQVRVTATIEPYHFGKLCMGPQYRRPTGSHDVIQTNDPIVFNPQVNGVVEPNQCSVTNILGVRQKQYFFVDPDSMRTAAGRTNAQDNTTAQSWKLADAVRTMCWICNPDETYIKNPSIADFDTWLKLAPEVKNLELPIGKYLPEYLDRMLNPAGYGWAMTFQYAADGSRRVSFRIFTLNDDSTIVLLQQRPGDSIGVQTAKTNVKEFDISTGIVGQANQITALGDWEEYEVTIELYRGFLESDDTYSAADLTQSTGSQWATHQRAWRRWVANEAGDYCGTRTSVAPIPFTPLDLSSVLGSDYLIRNRHPFDCLTHWVDDPSGEKKSRRPPFFEWYTASNTWAPLPNGWGETALDDELGCDFAADSPPVELIARGANARIRMTCTIRGDVRMYTTSNRSTDSVNLRVNELVIDVHDRYKSRVRQDTGPFASTLTGSSDVMDDTVALIEFTDKLKSIEDAAIVRGTIQLIGLHPELKVGQTVSDINGRNVSLNRMSQASATKKYLQIVQIAHDNQKQETLLKVAPILEDIV
jgi:hypothetical protein